MALEDFLRPRVVGIEEVQEAGRAVATVRDPFLQLVLLSTIAQYYQVPVRVVSGALDRQDSPRQAIEGRDDALHVREREGRKTAPTENAEHEEAGRTRRDGP